MYFFVYMQILPVVRTLACSTRVKISQINIDIRKVAFPSRDKSDEKAAVTEQADSLCKSNVSCFLLYAR